MHAESHVVMFHNVSAAAKNALLDSRQGEEAIPLLLDLQMQVLKDFFADGHIPDVNGMYPFDHTIDGATVVLLCKPRGFRRAMQQVGWAVAVVTRAECDFIDSTPVDERNAVVIATVQASGDEAAQWLTVY